MGLIFLLVVGAIFGWLAAIIVCADGRCLQLNLAAGVASALASGALVTPLIGGSLVDGPYSVPGLLVSLLGSVLVLFAVNVFAAPRIELTQVRAAPLARSNPGERFDRSSEIKGN
jgi:uncharacterized membrane protein YeaQ/YmgE (transglycosylase-associated protein family)